VSLCLRKGSLPHMTTPYLGNIARTWQD